MNDSEEYREGKLKSTSKRTKPSGFAYQCWRGEIDPESVKSKSSLSQDYGEDVPFA